MPLPFKIPYSIEMEIHVEKTGHRRFKITGNKKREKIRGLYCVTCKKYVSVISFTKKKKGLVKLGRLV